MPLVFSIMAIRESGSHGIVNCEGCARQAFDFVNDCKKLLFVYGSVCI